MKKAFLVVVLALGIHLAKAQYAFELQIEYATRIQNSDLFSISGLLVKGKIESGKDYYLEDGTKLAVSNVISAKTATSVPVASAPEGVSIGLVCKNYRPEHGDLMKAISSKPLYGGTMPSYNPNKTAEGELLCKINGRMYRAKSISKPVFIKSANVLDLFFESEDKSVIWLQVNNFSDIKDVPHSLKSDTSNHERMYVCKVAYLPLGYRPTDLPNNYKAYEDYKGNSGITLTYLDRYQKKISLEFSGILRANPSMFIEKPNSGLFYITEGHVDNIGWDAF